ncbi:hypothetical protein B9Z19DRAFT_1128351 [Tuber borchii]|uniref:Uncharacterized protein n=1 Tax=Tuber borchii TaxID=42251 RepID=A0A2T6ZPR3_TUBBO|nr:hypothetical protein B9Z19DRAFT_1128351 [Tuber borchii]
MSQNISTVLKLSYRPIIAAAAGSMIVASCWGPPILGIIERQYVRQQDAQHEKMRTISRASDDLLRRQKEGLKIEILQRKLAKMDREETAVAGPSVATQSSGNSN